MGHRGHPVLTEQVGKQPHHHLAIFQHVTHATGHAQVVFKNVVLTVALRIGRANNVNAADVRINVAGYIDPHHLGTELRILEDLLGRHNASLENVLTVVDVVNKAVKRRDALHQTFFHGGPLVSWNDAGNQVKGNQAFGARSVFVFGTVDSKGDTDPAKNHFSLGASRLHRLSTLARKPVLVTLIMRAHAVCAGVHFIKHHSAHVFYLQLLSKHCCQGSLASYAPKIFNSCIF